MQLVHEKIRGFVKEVQAGGPAPSQQQKPAQGADVASACGNDSQAAAKFREEELARQKVRPCSFVLLLLQSLLEEHIIYGEPIEACKVLICVSACSQSSAKSYILLRWEGSLQQAM